MRIADTVRWLSAQKGPQRDFVVYVFVPSKTRDGDPVDHQFWRTETLKTMSELFGGATAVEASGAWRDDGAEGAIKEELVSVVFSLMDPSNWNRDAVTGLGKYLQRMGREAKQGEVGLVVHGSYIPIRKFDEEKEEK